MEKNKKKSSPEANHSCLNKSPMILMLPILIMLALRLLSANIFLGDCRYRILLHALKTIFSITEPNDQVLFYYHYLQH